ncbi:MAG: hypothetical protein IJ010_03750 [Ruminococcus sp.]|mgnify:CR=1 FL=1|nr:hypothetical protein [Ruminococcus sp.]
MFGIVRKTKHEVRNRTVYMEVYGDNKVAYRVTAGWINPCGENICTYGVEAEDYTSGEKETIPDFSRNVEDAVDFVEMMITKRIRPKNMYDRALNYLCISI